jgi:hypothetical protein
MSQFITGGIAVAKRNYDTDKADLNSDGSTINRSYRVYSISRAAEIDENSAAGAVALATPLFRGSLIRRNLSLSRLNAYGWIVDVTWETFRPRDHSVSGFEEVIRGSTTGATTPITFAINHVATYKQGGGEETDPANMHGGALNVKRISGQQSEQSPLDIASRDLNFVIERTFPPGTVTQSYINTLYLLTSTVNNSSFRGAQEGELLFLGADFNLSNLEQETVSYSFSASPNVSGLKIGQYKKADQTYTITVSKEGHEYLWVENEDKEEVAANGKVSRVARPKLAHVEQVYQKSDFSLLGI